VHIGYWWERQKQRDHSEDQDVGMCIILKLILACWGGMDWIELAQDRNHWKVIVNTVMNH
jgi:hypothetical protein